MIPHNIRDFRPADDAHIYRCWLGSLAREEEGISNEPEDDDRFRAFKRRRRPDISRVLAAPGTKIRVMCSRKDPDVVLGWIVFELPATIHFLYVPKPWRKGGVARALVRDSGLAPRAIATHYTSWGFPRLKRLFESLEFDPMTLIPERNT